MRQKIAFILRATRQHARNLATFAFLYKAILLILRRTRRQIDPSLPKLSIYSSSLAPHYWPGQPVSRRAQPSIDHFIAGVVGGYYVFGRGPQGSVSQQIVIYIFARVVLGMAKLAVIPKKDGGWGILGHEQREQVGKGSWPVFAAASWGSVMWLFAKYPDVLQASLRGSMTYM